MFSQAHKPFIAVSVAVAPLAGLPMKRTGRVYKLLTEEVSNQKKLDSLLGKDWYILSTSVTIPTAVTGPWWRTCRSLSSSTAW
jgi:hypothetical protein